MLSHSSTLKAVVGAVAPTNMFDARFRPASELARAIGRRDIDAWVR